VYHSNRPAQRSPPALIHGKRDNLLTVRHQVRAEYWTDSGGITGTLKLHGSVDTVGVSTGQCAEPALSRNMSQDFGTGSAEPE